MRFPSFANAVYAPAISMGVTSKAPIAIEGYPLILELRPMRFASAATRSNPIRSATRIVARLSEC